VIVEPAGVNTSYVTVIPTLSPVGWFTCTAGHDRLVGDRVIASEWVPVNAAFVSFTAVTGPQAVFHPWVVPSSKSYLMDELGVGVGVGVTVGVAVGVAVGVGDVVKKSLIGDAALSLVVIGARPQLDSMVLSRE